MTVEQLLILGAAIAMAAIEGYRGGLGVTTLVLLSTMPWFYFFCLRNRSAELTSLMVCFAAAFFLEPIFVAIAEGLNPLLATLSARSLFPYYFLRIGIFEEMAKFSAVILVLTWLRVDSRQVIAMTAAAALGFATFESFFKLHHLWESSPHLALYSIAAGILVRIPIHVLISTLWGATMALSMNDRTMVRAAKVGGALLLAMAVHAWWDTIIEVLNAQTYLLFVTELIVIFAALWLAYFMAARRQTTLPLPEERIR